MKNLVPLEIAGQATRANNVFGQWPVEIKIFSKLT
jgi:hypothetical protein